jgi:toluene monooxygenase electron transfer component
VELETDKIIYRADPGACLPEYRTAQIAQSRLLAPGMLGFTLALDQPMSYEAGQFAALTVPGIAGFRVYSITNFARATRSIDLLVKRKPGGAFTEWLFGPESDGAHVRIFAPLGRATFSPALAKDLLIIAGGSGIAGMMSILARARQECYFGRHRGYIFFGVRTWADRFYLDEFAAMQAEFPDQLHVTVALSDEDVPEIATMRYPCLAFDRGLVHEVAARHMAGRYANLRAFVAGPPPAVDATLRYLVRDAKLSPTDIRFDKFA